MKSESSTVCQGPPSRGAFVQSMGGSWIKFPWSMDVLEDNTYIGQREDTDILNVSKPIPD